MSSKAEGPVTEVTEKAKRRRFTAEYRQRILREAAACTERGEIGALLRREGSHLTTWRQDAEQAQRAALTPKKRVLDAHLVAIAKRSSRSPYRPAT